MYLPFPVVRPHRGLHYHDVLAKDTYTPIVKGPAPLLVHCAITMLRIGGTVIMGSLRAHM